MLGFRKVNPRKWEKKLNKNFTRLFNEVDYVFNHKEAYELLAEIDSLRENCYLYSSPEQVRKCNDKKKYLLKILNDLSFRLFNIIQDIHELLDYDYLKLVVKTKHVDKSLIQKAIKLRYFIEDLIDPIELLYKFTKKALSDSSKLRDESLMNKIIYSYKRTEHILENMDHSLPEKIDSMGIHIKVKDSSLLKPVNHLHFGGITKSTLLTLFAVAEICFIIYGGIKTTQLINKLIATNHQIHQIKSNIEQIEFNIEQTEDKTYQVFLQRAMESGFRGDAKGAVDTILNAKAYAESVGVAKVVVDEQGRGWALANTWFHPFFDVFADVVNPDEQYYKAKFQKLLSYGKIAELNGKLWLVLTSQDVKKIMHEDKVLFLSLNNIDILNSMMGKVAEHGNYIKVSNLVDHGEDFMIIISIDKKDYESGKIFKMNSKKLPVFVVFRTNQKVDPEKAFESYNYF